MDKVPFNLVDKINKIFIIEVMEKRKISFKECLIVLISIIISFLLGIVFDDYLWGSLTLLFGFLNSYYMAIGKWENYIFGILFKVFNVRHLIMKRFLSVLLILAIALGTCSLTACEFLEEIFRKKATII